MWIGPIAAGLIVFIISNVIVSATFRTSEIKMLERQKTKLKKNHARVIKNRRDKDSFVAH
jgi:Mg2+/Co2+ transporter CorB